MLTVAALDDYYEGLRTRLLAYEAGGPDRPPIKRYELAAAIGYSPQQVSQILGPTAAPPALDFIEAVSSRLPGFEDEMRHYIRVRYQVDEPGVADEMRRRRLEHLEGQAERIAAEAQRVREEIRRLKGEP